MTLQVSFDDFAATVKRLLGPTDVYLAPHGEQFVATCADPGKALVVAAVASGPRETIEAELTERELKVYPGTWLTGEEALAQMSTQTPTYVAAVAYKTNGDRPGLWVDAYPMLPTQVTVLRTMFDEFRATGEIDDLPFEEFVQLANPTVVVASPTEIQSFLKQKEEC